MTSCPSAASLSPLRLTLRVAAVQDLESALAAERERSAGKAEQLNLRLREAQLAKDEAVVLQRQLQAQCKAQAAEVLKLKAKVAAPHPCRLVHATLAP